MTTQRNTRRGLGLITAAALTTLGTLGSSAIAGGGGGNDCVVPNLTSFHTLDTDLFSLPWSIKVNGTTAYGSFFRGVIEIVDIADPANPVTLNTITTPGLRQTSYDIEMKGRYGFVPIAVRDGPIPPKGLRVFDLIDPANPVEVGMIPNLHFNQLEIRGDLMYALAGVDFEPTRIYTLDISDPTNPTILGWSPLPFHALSLGDGLDVANGKAYVAGFAGGLHIYDLSDPTDPALLSTFTGIELPFDVKVIGDHAFVTSTRNGGNGSLFSVDVSDPTSPVIDDVWGNWEQTMSLEVEGTTGYAIKMEGNGLERMLVFDLSDPQSIQLIGSSETIYTGLDIVNGTLYGFGPQPVGFDTVIKIEMMDVSNSCNPSCEADLTGDGVLDFFDISSFLQSFGNGDPVADFTGDGSFDFFDISSFLTSFGTGCP